MTKKYNVIPIESYYVVVDESSPKSLGDYILMDRLIIGQFEEGNAKFIQEDPKVVATIGKRVGELPLIEIPDECEVYIDKLAHQMYPDHPSSRVVAKSHMRIGYKAATKKYSEEDMVKAISMARAMFEAEYHSTKEILESFNKSISSVELELICKYEEGQSCNLNNLCKHPNCLKVSETNTITPINIFYAASS